MSNSHPDALHGKPIGGGGSTFSQPDPFGGPRTFGVQLPASSSRCFGSDNQINAGSHPLSFCVWVFVYLSGLMRCGVSVKQRRPRGLCLRLRDRGIATRSRVHVAAATGQQD